MFSKHEIATFLRCSQSEVDRIFDQLRITYWFDRLYTADEARAVMAQFYRRKGAIADRGVEPRGKG